MTVSNRTVAVSRKVQKRFILVVVFRVDVSYMGSDMCFFFVVAVASRFFFFCQINRTKDLHKQNKKPKQKLSNQKQIWYSVKTEGL